MDERILLVADEGYVYANGEVYGSTIYLAEGESAENFRQITREQYEAEMLMQNESAQNDELIEAAKIILGVE